MELVTDPASAVPPGQGSVVTIGAYDGVHLGHQAVIAAVRSKASQEGWRSAVVTFDRHPAMVVRPESAPKLLTDAEQKLELLAASGVDVTVMLRFDEHRAKEGAEEFVQEVLVDALAARVVVVGRDFHFGRDRQGNVELLARLGRQAGFTVVGLDLLPRPDGIDEPVSSTAIRRALAGGEVDLAALLLGRDHEVRGEVVPGDKRGRTIGFPTANVRVPAAIALPADGVYAGHYERPDGTVWRCAINLGRRPTFYDHAEHSLLEAHLLDFDGDLYGEVARVRFTHFLRSERKFSGIDELVAQLRHDVDHARQVTPPG